MKLLIVDDQYRVVEGLQWGINWQNIGVDQVYTALSAFQAKETIGQEEIKIILCDIEMPGENGIELIRWVKRRYPHISCIVLTAHADFAYAQEALKLACTDYILQPASYPVIEESVRRAVQELCATAKKKELEQMGDEYKKQEKILIRNSIKNYLTGVVSKSQFFKLQEKGKVPAMELLLTVKEHYPDMNIIVPHGGRIIPRMIQDRLGNNIGVLVNKENNSSLVENFYKSDYFYNLCIQMREWNQNGLFMEKAYMGKEDRQSYLAQGDSFGSFLNLSEISIFNIARYVQYPMAAVQLAPRIADSDSCNMIWCISRDSKNPQLAMKVLNLMYTDVEISRLLAYGQEGIDYEFAGAGYVKPADTPDYSPAERWTSKVWSWPVGVEIEQWQEEEGLLDQVVFWDEPVRDSPALGFLFDVSEVRVEVDACQYIIDKYENALLCGELWPKTGIESFNKELEAAGIDRVITEKQRQLNEFMKKYQ